MATYPFTIDYIKPGESVTSAVTNRPVKQLATRTEGLSDRLDAAAAGEALILRDMPVSANTADGMPVYWDAENCRFAPAHITTVQNTSGEYLLGDTAYCVGLIYHKITTDSADVILSGVVSLPAIRNFINSGTGPFFLTTEPGALSLECPMINIPVGILIGPKNPCDESDYVSVNPKPLGPGFSHYHCSHTLDPANWKAADQFANAPTGAIAGYDIDADATLKKMFPPIPLSSVSCTIDWMGRMESGDPITETYGGRDIPVNTDNSIIRVTNGGIWWFGEDLLPYPAGSDTTNTYREFHVTLQFSRLSKSTLKSVVTQLRPYEGHPFQFVDEQGQEATSGSLYAKFTLAQGKVAATTLTGDGLQQITADYKQETAPIIHGIRSTTGNLVVSGTDFSYNDTVYKHGLLTLQATPYAEDYELSPQVVKLTSAVESDYQNMVYLGLPNGRNSSFTMRIEVPGSFGTNLQLKMRFLLFSPIAGTFPSLTLNYIRIPRPAATAALNLTSSAVSLITNRATTPVSVFEAESAEINVSEGDTLLLTLGRSNASGYAANAGVVRMAGILNIAEA